MRTVAPAKVNWTLEVLGRRSDGFHEVRTVLQAIDICDTVAAEPSESLSVPPWEGGGSPEDDLAWRAARMLQEVCRRPVGATVRIRKRIPVAAGLGGGSSDAAATLRLLNRLWGLELSPAALASLAARVSSDAPFFVYGGVALCSGRGEQVSPLPDMRTLWLVVVVPPVSIQDKTRRMYEALEARDFTDGSHSEELAKRLRRDGSVVPEMTYNAFAAVALRVFPGLESYQRALSDASAGAVHLAGSGPALFCMARSEGEAREIAGRVRLPDARVFVARTLGSEESVAIHEGR